MIIMIAKHIINSHNNMGGVPFEPVRVESRPGAQQCYYYFYYYYYYYCCCYYYY